MPGGLVQPLHAEGLLHLEPLERRPGVEVRARIEDLAGAVEEHARFALARRGHAADAAARRQRGEGGAGAARQGPPEGRRVQIEPPDEGYVGVGEATVVEPLASRGQRATALVVDDAATRARSRIQRDEAVHGHARSARTRPADVPSPSEESS